MTKRVAFFLLIASAAVVSAREFHVSPQGNDQNDGSAAKPLKTISAAAQLAQPGDVITIHEGTYRERVSPPRGGTSDSKRIVYQAAPGEKPVIKGSEPVKGWQKVQNDTWKVTLPNTFFGSFNPYADAIRGDWFNPLGRQHHTGAVYLNGHWLVEAANLDDVLKPIGQASPRPGATGEYLLNVAWFRPASDSGAARIPAAGFAAQNGVQTAPCSEGGECIGWIEHGDWVRYDNVDFGASADRVEFRAASVTKGGWIELHQNDPDGALLGRCKVTHTGDWQLWASFTAKIKPLSGKQTICLVFKSAEPADKADASLWFAQVDATETTIWAQFDGVNPNEADVEINVRQAVFYPEKPGVNYITVRGLTMMHAATPWAPPTAEQIGCIGTHWSKGWIIEDNDIRYSTCVGVTLGKHGDEFDNTSANTAEGYVKTIERGLARGWSRAHIGGHVVRNNHIAHCEQAGIVGSLGAIFCTITDNEIHDIHVRRLFTGAEMAGIKIHAAIDTLIARNHIHHTCRGIWLDWMAQGTRVTSNLLYDNGPWEDLFVEVNHGPFMIDNNLFLSPSSLFDMSQGGAYVHNLFAGRVAHHPELGRETPFHPAHSTEVAGLRKIEGGDDRFYNNLFVAPAGLSTYDKAARPMHMAGNVFLKGARPSVHEPAASVRPDFDPQLQLASEDDGVYLRLVLGKDLAETRRQLVTTDLLGKTAIAGLPYQMPDGTPYRIDTDYHGARRNPGNPFPGPFENLTRFRKLWPAMTR